MKKTNKKEIGSRGYFLLCNYDEGPNFWERVVKFQAYNTNKNTSGVYDETITVNAKNLYFRNKDKVLKKINMTRKSGEGFVELHRTKMSDKGPRPFVEVGIIDANKGNISYYYVPMDNLERRF